MQGIQPITQPLLAPDPHTRMRLPDMCVKHFFYPPFPLTEHEQ